MNATIVYEKFIANLNQYILQPKKAKDDRFVLYLPVSSVGAASPLHTLLQELQECEQNNTLRLIFITHRSFHPYTFYILSYLYAIQFAPCIPRYICATLEHDRQVGVLLRSEHTDSISLTQYIKQYQSHNHIHEKEWMYLLSQVLVTFIKLSAIGLSFHTLTIDTIYIERNPTNMKTDNKIILRRSDGKTTILYTLKTNATDNNKPTVLINSDLEYLTCSEHFATKQTDSIDRLIIEFAIHFYQQCPMLLQTVQKVAIETGMKWKMTLTNEDASKEPLAFSTSQFTQHTAKPVSSSSSSSNSKRRNNNNNNKQVFIHPQLQSFGSIMKTNTSMITPSGLTAEEWLKKLPLLEWDEDSAMITSSTASSSSSSSLSDDKNNIIDANIVPTPGLAFAVHAQWTRTQERKQPLHLVIEDDLIGIRTHISQFCTGELVKSSHLQVKLYSNKNDEENEKNTPKCIIA